jgi:hypothetical protein
MRSGTADDPENAKWGYDISEELFSMGAVPRQVNRYIFKSR